MNRQSAIESAPSQTLAKGLQILEVFNTERPTWGIRELARELEMTPATVARLVATLVGAGYLERDPETQRYALGPAVVKLANLYMHLNPLPHYARKIFESYSDRFDYNFYLGTLNGYQVVYLAVLDGRGRIKLVVEPGGSTGLHSTALGKALLAHQNDEFIEAFVRSSHFRPYTDTTINDAETLWAQLREIRRSGYSTNNGEHFADIGSVAAPVFNRQRRALAAVSLAYPRNLAPEQSLDPRRLIPIVKEIAERISLYMQDEP